MIHKLPSIATAPPPRNEQIRRLVLALVGALLLFGGGSFAYKNALHCSLFDGFYHTAWTSLLHPIEPQHSPRVQALNVIIGVLGVAFFGYILANALNIIASQFTAAARERKRIVDTMNKLEGHYIICGYGRVGRRAAQEFIASGDPFVIVDVSEAVCAQAREAGLLCVQGSAHENSVLLEARIDTARGLIATADSDSENLYIALSSRTLNPDLLIIARAGNSDAETKLRLVGANHVVQPFTVAGVEAANIALKPQLASFLDLVSSHKGRDLRFEQFTVREGAPRSGSTIREIWTPEESRALIVATQEHDGSWHANPAATTVLEPGMILIALGSHSQLADLEARVGAVAAAA
ncbi:MAG: hypothetical protein F2663_04730 [Actinobacteria bacterium]|uniref:Unannotated protein n=1 Tax=freshwater metagenome TaxID=449393 RepID=A0A6J6PDQ5_9ZZZZ|nr:hypothetical protein [Actinomycetota bacterium]